MSEYKVIEIKQSIFADNDREAEKLREELKEKGTFLLNLMSKCFLKNLIATRS